MTSPPPPAGSSAEPTVVDRPLLLDGVPIAVRVLGPADRTAFMRLHDDLPAADRWLRFLRSGGGYGHEDVDRALDPEGGSIVLGAFLGGELVGVVHVAADTLPSVDGQAEVAVAVGHTVQARGVGTLLLEAAARVCRRRGVCTWVAFVSRRNAGMLTVLDDLGLPSEARGTPDTVEITVDLTPVDDPGSRFAFAGYEREVRADRASLDPVLHPRTVAVVGASRRHGAVGRAVLESLVEGGFRGRLLVVNPHAASVARVRSWPSVDALPEVPDLAVVATPAAAVPDVAEACGRRGVRALVVITAGLGRSEADRLRDAARRHGMRLVGPNCLGLARGDLDATFAHGPVPAGHVGLVTQSGGVAIAVVEAFRRLGLGFSSLVSIGDRLDVSSNDLLRWWAADETTRVALLHVESFGNPRAFARTARRLAGRIPVIAVRAAGSEAGARAAASHTAASATPAVRRDALFDQAGVIAVDGLREAVVAAGALSWSPSGTGRKVAVVSNAGGLGVIAADACARRGLDVPTLSSVTRERLGATLPGTAAVANPVDTTATVSAAAYASCLRVVLEDPGVDAVLAVTCPTAVGDPGVGVRRALAAAAPHRPVVHVDLAQAPAVAALRPTSSHAVARPAPVGIRVADPADGALALDVLARRAAHLARPPGHRLDEDVDLTAVARVVADLLASRPDGGWLDPEGCRLLLDAAGIPQVPTTVVAPTVDAVTAAARAVGGPVALKADALGTLHKSRAGGVRLGVLGDDAVRAAVADLTATFSDRLRAVVVQPMAPAGTELLVGLTSGPEDLPLLTLGVGGTGTDLADRRWHRLVPLDDVDVHELVGSLPWSGSAAGLDRAALETLVARVARLAELVPQIEEADLNPVVCTPSDARAVDARVRLLPRRPHRPVDR